MKIPNPLTECYEALGLVPLGTGDMSKREQEPKALYCKNLITSFLQLDSRNSIYEARDPLDQFQQRAETWVRFNASKLWAATDRADLFPGAPTYPRDKDM